MNMKGALRWIVVAYFGYEVAPGAKSVISTTQPKYTLWVDDKILDKSLCAVIFLSQTTGL